VTLGYAGCELTRTEDPRVGGSILSLATTQIIVYSGYIGEAVTSANLGAGWLSRWAHLSGAVGHCQPLAPRPSSDGGRAIARSFVSPGW